MLRIYFLQQWYQLSDPGAEEALYDIQSMRAFAGLELGRDAIPDETTILNFRHLLERHELTKALFEAVGGASRRQGCAARGGTIMDATLIAASPSTKNKSGKRDPEMGQSKKGNQWYFGMKAHVGVDARSGLVHTAGVTTGKIHDAKVMDNLIREDDRAVFADKGYVSENKKRAARRAGVYCGREGEGASRAGSCRLTEETQPPLRQGARQGRARVPRPQMPVRLSQGSLSRHRQERRAGVRAAGARQPLSRPRPNCVRLRENARPEQPCSSSRTP